MIYSLTNDDLIMAMGGHAKSGLGSQRHLPIFRAEDGSEWVSLNGQTLTRISELDLSKSKRETVQRG